MVATTVDAIPKLKLKNNKISNEIAIVISVLNDNDILPP